MRGFSTSTYDKNALRIQASKRARAVRPFRLLGPKARARSLASRADKKRRASSSTVVHNVSARSASFLSRKTKRRRVALLARVQKRVLFVLPALRNSRRTARIRRTNKKSIFERRKHAQSRYVRTALTRKGLLRVTRFPRTLRRTPRT